MSVDPKYDRRPPSSVDDDDREPTWFEIWRMPLLFVSGLTCMAVGAGIAGGAAILAMSILGMRSGPIGYVFILGAAVITGSLIGLMTTVPIWTYTETLWRRRLARKAAAAEQRRLRDLIEGPRRPKRK
jgi:uncharacterized membrane protein YccC